VPRHNRHGDIKSAADATRFHAMRAALSPASATEMSAVAVLGRKLGHSAENSLK
jgi:hypothetical protein